MAPLVALTSVHGSFTAHLVAARLGHEGIDVELRGALGSHYGLTVGDLARVDLWVPADQIDDARLVMLAFEIDEIAGSAFDPVSVPGLDAGLDDRPRARRVWPWIIAVVVIVAAAAPPALWSLPG